MSRYNISNVRAAFVDTKTGALTKFGIDVLQRISDVLGLPSGDNVSDSASRDTYDSTSYAAAIDDTNKRIKDLSKYDYEQPFLVKEIKTKVISRETYTATDDMFIRMTNNSTLILPLYPKKNSIIYLSKDSTRAVLKGNGRKVNGTLQDVIFRKDNLARQIHYFIEVDEWFFI